MYRNKCLCLLESSALSTNIASYEPLVVAKSKVCYSRFDKVSPNVGAVPRLPCMKSFHFQKSTMPCSLRPGYAQDACIAFLELENRLHLEDGNLQLLPTITSLLRCSPEHAPLPTNMPLLRRSWRLTSMQKQRSASASYRRPRMP